MLRLSAALLLKRASLLSSDLQTLSVPVGGGHCCRHRYWTSLAKVLLLGQVSHVLETISAHFVTNMGKTLWMRFTLRYSVKLGPCCFLLVFSVPSDNGGKRLQGLKELWLSALFSKPLFGTEQRILMKQRCRIKHTIWVHLSTLSRKMAFTFEKQ